MDLPVVIEIVDSKEKIEAFLPVFNEMIKSGLSLRRKYPSSITAVEITSIESNASFHLLANGWKAFSQQFQPG